MINLTEEIRGLGLVEVPRDVETIWNEGSEEILLVNNFGEVLSREFSDSDKGRLGASVVAIELLRELLEGGYTFPQDVK